MALINSKNEESSHVKFISYNGRYPNLCSGVLVLEIDGMQYKFGHNSDKLRLDNDSNKWRYIDENPDHPNFEPFWTSGGYISRDYNTVRDEWIIDVDALPEQFKHLATELDKVFNGNVKWGCCGGCI